MPRKGIQPIIRTMTVVLRNGASVQMATTKQFTKPYMLQVDPTNHPAWTGVEAFSGEDEHMVKFLKRFEGYGEASIEAPADAEQQPNKAEPDKPA